MGHSALHAPVTPLAVALLARLLAAIALGTLHHPELYETEDIVRNWKSGPGLAFDYLGTTYYTYHTFLPSTLIYAVVHWLSDGNPTANLVVQWLFAILLCWAGGWLGQRLGGPAVATLARWLIALHPALVIYDATKLQQITFDAAMVLLALIAYVRWVERPGLRPAIASGVLMGVLMYERGSLLLFFPLALWWVKCVSRMNWQDWIRQATLSALIAALLLAPWVIRNQWLYQRFVPMTSTTWMILWIVNNENATGTECMRDGRPFMLNLPDPLKQALARKTELEQAQVFREATLAAIGSQWGRVAWRHLQRLGYFWWRSPSTGLTYPRLWTPVYQVYYAGLLGFALLGVCTLRAQDSPAWALGKLILSLALALSVLQASFYVAGRHRLIVEPSLLLLTAVGLLSASCPNCRGGCRQRPIPESSNRWNLS